MVVLFSVTFQGQGIDSHFLEEEVRGMRMCGGGRFTKKKCLSSMIKYNIKLEHVSIGDCSLFLKDIATVGICKKQRKRDIIHRKKRFTSFPSPAGMSLTKLPLGRNNSVMTSLFPPRESLVVTSRLGTGNSRTFFYGVTKILSGMALRSSLFKK
jgi:hypothetical protein